MLPLESAIAIVVPEAEGLVKPFRDVHDPAAAVGVPAHITILYPFKRPDRIGTQDLERLKALFALHAAFSFSLTGLGTFGREVLYLDPRPAETFVRLTEALVEVYPDLPPYGGRFAEVVPHLTVADRIFDPQALADISSAFAHVARTALPIAARASQVTLLDTTSGRWATRASFALGSASLPAT
jgi:2'-5' RNA ligase